MPYKDPEKRKEVQARSYRNRLATKPGFKEAEAARKAEWLATEAGALSNQEASKRHRVKTAKAKKTARPRARKGTSSDRAS